MKKIILLTSLLLMSLILLTGCGQNKKKAEILGLSSAPVVATAQDTQLASSAGAMYDVTKAGTGVGTVSFAVRSRYTIGSDMADLGTADDQGFYTVTNQLSVISAWGVVVLYFCLVALCATFCLNIYLKKNNS